jgi:hypothetical protein
LGLGEWRDGIGGSELEGSELEIMAPGTYAHRSRNRTSFFFLLGLHIMGSRGLSALRPFFFFWVLCSDWHWWLVFPFNSASRTVGRIGVQGGRIGVYKRETGAGMLVGDSMAAENAVGMWFAEYAVVGG